MPATATIINHALRMSHRPDGSDACLPSNALGVAMRRLTDGSGPTSRPSASLVVAYVSRTVHPNEVRFALVNEDEITVTPLPGYSVPDTAENITHMLAFLHSSYSAR